MRDDPIRDDPTTDDRLANHPAAEIETVVVDPDDVLEALRRNRAESNPLHTHVLRLTPPFEETVRAEPYRQEGPRRYPPDRDPEPLHLEPGTFVRNDASDHPNETHLLPPTVEGARNRARDDHGDDVDEETVETYHADALETWEQRVRDALLPRVRIYFEDATGNEIWTDARYESATE